MPIVKKWSKLNEKNIGHTPNVYGVYEFGNRSGEVIYIGHAKLKNRLIRHWNWESDGTIGEKPYYFRYETTGSKLRGEQRERALLRKYEKQSGKLPKYNEKRG